jgi:hypothetical protein
MLGAILPLSQYAFMAWFSVKRKAQGQLYLYFNNTKRIVKTKTCFKQLPVSFLVHFS